VRSYGRSAAKLQVLGLQEAAAESFDKLISPKYNGVREKDGAAKHY
jgi:hypothetical protein